MRKPDELELFNICRRSARDCYSTPIMLRIFDVLGMHPNRGRAILRKWTNQGWWDYGVNVCSGWFTSQAPELVINA